MRQLVARIARVPGIRPLGRIAIRSAEAIQFQMLRRSSGLMVPPTIARPTAIEMFRGTFEPETVALLRTLLALGDLFVDVGANIGYFSRLGATLVGPAGMVCAVEPEPENFASLAANTRGLPQVLACQLALSDRDGVAQLLLSSHASSHSLVANGHYLDSGARGVLALRYDTLAALLDRQGPAVVKLDIEGAEPLALAGMERALASGAVRQIICEYGPALLERAGFAPTAIWELLTPHVRLRPIDPPPGISASRDLDADGFARLTERLLASQRVAVVNLWGRREP